MTEALTIAGVFGAAMGVVMLSLGIIKTLVEKAMGKKNGNGSESMAMKIGAMDANLQRIAESQEEATRLLGHLPRLLEMQDSILELITAESAD